MGTPVPEPIVVPPGNAGDFCNACWGPGQPFGDVDTPDEVIVSISGVNKGPTWTALDGPPVNGVLTLSQDAFAPCRFELSDPNNIALFQFILGTSQLLASVTGFPVSFAASLLPVCTLEFVNQAVGKFTGGTAIVYLPEVP